MSMREAQQFYQSRLDRGEPLCPEGHRIVEFVRVDHGDRRGAHVKIAYVDPIGKVQVTDAMPVAFAEGQNGLPLADVEAQDAVQMAAATERAQQAQDEAEAARQDAEQARAEAEALARTREEQMAETARQRDEIQRQMDTVAHGHKALLAILRDGTPAEIQAARAQLREAAGKAPDRLTLPAPADPEAQPDA